MERDIKYKVLELHGKLSYREIGNRLGVSKSTVERIIKEELGTVPKADRDNEESVSHLKWDAVSLENFEAKRTVPHQIIVLSSQVSIYKMDFNDYAEEMIEAFSGKWHTPYKTVLKYLGRAERLRYRLKFIAEVFEIDFETLHHYSTLKKLEGTIQSVAEEAEVNEECLEDTIELPLVIGLVKELKKCLNKDLLQVT